MISYGQFETEFLEKLAGDIRSEFRLPVHVQERYSDLTPYFDASRRQYDGNKLLKLIEAMILSKNTKAIGLFQVDLFIPILTYIFGQALFRGNSGVVSTFRLRNEYYGLPQDDKILLERFRKVIIHELGHTFGLMHCHFPSCVMRSSTYVEDIDQKKYYFCTKCRNSIDLSVDDRI